MADFHARYFSQALTRSVSFYVYLPLDADRNANPEQFARPPKTVLLLHGYTGDAASWKLDTPIYSLAAKYNLALIMPDGENSFYLDGEATGRQYGTFVGKELPDFAHRAFGLSSNREDNFVAGISMGGFGAVHTGLAYPDAFAKIAAFSPLLSSAGWLPCGRRRRPTALRTMSTTASCSANRKRSPKAATAPKRL